MALSSTLKATIALLIIVVVVTVVVVVVAVVVVVVTVVVVVVVTVVVVVVVVTVVVVVVVAVVVVGRPPGLCSASYSVDFDCSWKDHHSFFSFLPDVQHRKGLILQSISVVNSNNFLHGLRF
ncbi:hypothetical protein Tco_0775958 [Tanacetum coccineum]